MKPSSTLLVAALAIISGGLLGLARHRLLSSLEQDLALRRISMMHPGSDASEPNPFSKGPHRPREQSIYPPLVRSQAGREHLAEVVQCFATYFARGHYSAPERNHYPEVDQMKEFLAGMGADAAEEVFNEISRDDHTRGLIRDLFDSLYASMNPSQALLLTIGRPADDYRKHAILNAFTSWTYADPEAAWHWQREEMKKGTPDAIDPAMQMQAAIFRSRTDPQQGVEAIEQLARSIPGSVSAEMGTNLAVALRTPEEKISLLHALESRAAASPDAGNLLSAIRASVIQRFKFDLASLSPGEAVPVLEEAYTSDERREFATWRISMPVGSLSEAKEWISWLAGQEGLPSFGNPLPLFIGNTSTRFPNLLDNLDWIENLASHEARQKAIASVVPMLAPKRPEEARRWVEQLDDGPVKEEQKRSLESNR